MMFLDVSAAPFILGGIFLLIMAALAVTLVIVAVVLIVRGVARRKAHDALWRDNQEILDRSGHDRPPTVVSPPDETGDIDHTDKKEN